MAQPCLRNSDEVAGSGTDARDRSGGAGSRARVLSDHVGLRRAGAVPPVEVMDRRVGLADEDAEEAGASERGRVARDLRTDRAEVARLYADRVQPQRTHPGA